MKKMLYFIPTLVVLVFFVFILIVLSGPTNQLDDYIVGIAILVIFAVSDWQLSKQKWYGCVPCTLLGAYIIYYGSQYHGQVLDERPIGVVICLYYLIFGIVAYKKSTMNKTAK